jgi:hypothetical protein
MSPPPPSPVPPTVDGVRFMSYVVVKVPETIPLADITSTMCVNLKSAIMNGLENMNLISGPSADFYISDAAYCEVNTSEPPSSYYKIMISLRTSEMQVATKVLVSEAYLPTFVTYAALSCDTNKVSVEYPNKTQQDMAGRRKIVGTGNCL